MNTKKLEILLVEDNCDDAQLCLRTLKKSNLDFRCDLTATPEEFAERVDATQYDVILCDYNVSGWTAYEALEHLHKRHCETPVILVTGSLGDEKAVECIQKGIADYVLKDRLQRLPLAIARCLDLKAARDEQQRVMRETEEKCRLLLESMPAAVFLEGKSTFRFVNRAAQDMTGYERAELLTMRFIDLVHDDSRELFLEQVNRRAGYRYDLTSRVEIKLHTKEGDARWADVILATSPLQEAESLITAFDVTERKRAEQQNPGKRDPVTGLANYAKMTEVFDVEAGRTDRTGRPFTVVLFQLSGLKEVKAKHGYLTVQQALCRFARIMCLHSRSLDSAFRIGEDEFAFILPETGIEGAPVLGRRIVSRLSIDGEQASLSGRFGIAGYPGAGKTIDEIVKVARKDVGDRFANASPKTVVVKR